MSKIMIVRREGAEPTVQIDEGHGLKDIDLVRKRIHGLLVVLQSTTTLGRCAVRESISEIVDFFEEGAAEHDKDTQEIILHLLDDDVNYFKQKKESMSSYEQTRFCSYAAVVGAFDVVKLFFSKNCDPVHVALYAICSGDVDAVQQFVNDHKVDASNSDFFDLAEALGNQALKDFYEAQKSEKLTQQAARAAGHFAGTQAGNQKQHQLSGEFLESFNELLRNELDSLLEIQDLNVRKLLIDAVWDEKLTAEQLGRYAAAIDPVIGYRLAVIASCLSLKRWDEEFVRPFKTVVIDSYLDRSGLASANDQAVNWLKRHARQFVAEYLHPSKEVLSPEEIIKKNQILSDIEKEVPDTPRIRQASEGLKSDVDFIVEVLEEEKPKRVASDSKGVALVADGAPVGFGKNSYSEIFMNKDLWSKIYDVVKYTSPPPGGRVRDEKKMKEVLRAIAHKEEHHLRWKELPAQLFPNIPSVQYYYRLWRSNGVMNQIRVVLAGEQPNAAPTLGGTHA